MRTIVDALRTSSTLRKLNLYNCRLGHSAGRALGEALACNSSLEALNLGNNALLDHGVNEIMKGLNRNPVSRLCELLLASTRLQNTNGWLVAHVAHGLPALTSLDLRYNEIGDEEMKELWRASQAHGRLRLWLV